MVRRALCILTWLFVLSACSRPALPRWLGGQPTAMTPTPITVTTDLTLWAWPSTTAEDMHLRSLVAAFSTQHPDVNIDVVLPDNYTRRVRTSLGTDGAPDILLITLQQLPDLVAQGVLAPLPSTFADDSDLYPHLRRAVQSNGTTYCVPQHSYTLALFYNQTFFDNAGLPYPDATWDWTAFQAAATSLTNAEANRYGVVLPADVSRWLAFLAQAGGTLLTDDESAMALNSPAGEAAIDFYTGLVLDRVAAPPSAINSRWPGEAFAQERAAMMIEANWAVSYLHETVPDLAYGISPLPVGPAGTATVSFTSCFALVQKEIMSAAAMDLLSHLTSAENQQSWFAVHEAMAPRPSLAAQWTAKHATMQPFVADMDHAVEWQLPANFQGWLDETNNEFRRVFGGFILPDALLPQAEALGNELLGAETGEE